MKSKWGYASIKGLIKLQTKEAEKNHITKNSECKLLQIYSIAQKKTPKLNNYLTTQNIGGEYISII
jgi:ribosomal protein L11